MQASDYLRMKFQNDRRLALTTQNAVGGVFNQPEVSLQIYILVLSELVGIHHFLYLNTMIFVRS